MALSTSDTPVTRVADKQTAKPVSINLVNHLLEVVSEFTCGEEILRRSKADFTLVKTLDDLQRKFSKNALLNTESKDSAFVLKSFINALNGHDTKFVARNKEFFPEGKVDAASLEKWTKSDRFTNIIEQKTPLSNCETKELCGLYINVTGSRGKISDIMYARIINEAQKYIEKHGDKSKDAGAVRSA